MQSKLIYSINLQYILKLFYSPIPQYKWSRVDGKPLPPRSHISNYGRVLKIEKVNYGDAGKYKCVATNAFGAAAGEVHVKLRGIIDNE